MTRFSMRIAALLCSLLVLSACAEKTPEEVTQRFWQAVIADDAKDAVEYSTLSDVRDYNGFERNWSGFTPSFGKIVIDGERASVTTTLRKTTSAGDELLEFDTLLIRQDERWKVDYTRTAKEVSGGPFSKLFGRLEQMGKSLSEQLTTSSEQLTAEMERMGTQLENLSQSLGEQATEIIEQEGEQLRKSIKEFSESTRRALKEYENSLSDKDRKLLREVADDLDEQGDNLESEPSLSTIAEGGKSVAVANQKLGAIDNAAIASYQEQWQAWGQKVEQEMQDFVKEVSASAEQ